MTAVTARVLCLPSDGDPHTGSGFILGDGAHLVSNWHVVACTREPGQAQPLAPGSRFYLATPAISFEVTYQ